MVMHLTNTKAEKAGFFASGSLFSGGSAQRKPGQRTRSRTYRSIGKRALETAMILLSAPLSLLFMAIMAVLIAMDGHNPFYTQLRVGRQGRHFRIWKLRTMVPDADTQLANYLEANPQAREEWRTTQKLKADPRITRLGRLLRKTSLDELPQLWNVLNGTMALIGPRPMMVCQQNDYRGHAYYRLRPGITGLWQVSERNEGEFVGRVRYDEVYDRTLSLRLDAWIVLRSFAVVLRGTGY